MSTPPPDKDRFPYPTDTVVAFAGDDAAVTEAVRGLDAAGIPGDRVDQLLAVSVSDREQAQLAGGALRDAGLTSVRYYSRHVVETL